MSAFELYPGFGLAKSLRMSSASHTVILGPSFLGWGNRPDFTPAHQVDLETGMGPAGARMSFSRR
jgi:hypothetical protein